MKTYVIVGASSGIGKALARTLLNQGHRVIGTFCTNDVEISHDRFELHQMDIRKEPDFSFLPENIDGLAYCPGSINLKPFQRIGLEEFMEDFDLQVKGAIKTLQLALPSLKAENGGSVVFFSTVAVQRGFPFHAQVAASKGAIEGLTRALAAEYAPRVRVNALAPSITRTSLAKRLISSDEKEKANADRHPMKRIGEPEDLADAASFLLSEQSTWITGQVIHVDGGMSTLVV